MPTQQPESPNLLILILFGFFLKVLFDFKLMGGFNYPLLIKLLYMLYMIMIVLTIVILFHPEDLKKAVKQAKIEDYFKK